MFMRVLVALTIASAGKLDMVARRISRRLSGLRWISWPRSPVKELREGAILGILDDFFSLGNYS
jgi:hypothetical protein